MPLQYVKRFGLVSTNAPTQLKNVLLRDFRRTEKRDCSLNTVFSETTVRVENDGSINEFCPLPWTYLVQALVDYERVEGRPPKPR